MASIQVVWNESRTEQKRPNERETVESAPIHLYKSLISRAVFLEKPPTSKCTTSGHSRNNSSNSRGLLSVFENKPGVKGSGVRSLPSSPLLRPIAGSSTPKYLPMGGSPRIAPLSSPRLPPSSPKSSSTPLRMRLIHMLALGSSTEQVLQEKTRALRTELSTCLQDVARKIAPGSSSWELKDESYRDLRPKEWKNYTSKERDMVEKKQQEVLARLLPPVEPEAKVASQLSDIPKKRTENDVSETSRLAPTTSKPMDSTAKPYAITPSLPAKRSAEEDAVNPIRKVGGGIISAAKKKSTKVTPRESTPKPLPKETVTPRQSKIPPAKKAKENPKVKSAEKIVDSDSDSDIPLQTQIKSTVKPRPSEPKTGLRGLGISATEREPKRLTQTISPPASNRYRSTSSASSTNSYSPPKKRSPLATNQPVTASRRVKSPAPPSPPPGARKRPRDDDLVPKGDKRQKLQTEKRTTSSPQTIKRETDVKKIGQEYHNLANRFRKLYPEYQELHRRLQSLDTDRLAKEKGNVEKLFRMQEQLERWKAVLWKAAGETRRVASTTERTNGMVGVKG